MTRTEEREQAFVLIFEKEFNMDTSMDDIISYAAEADVFSESAFASSLAKAVFENIDAVDAVIDKYSIGWKKSRLPKTTLRNPLGELKGASFLGQPADAQPS